MALQVWLPLNGSLKNCGLNTNVAITQNGGAAAYSSGVLPNGLSCNGSKNWRINPITLTAEATIAWWSKTTANGKMPWVLECAASDRLNFYESSIYTLNTGDSNNNPFVTDSNANINVLHDGIWHHFVVTFGSNLAKLYIDGVYTGTAKTFRSPACANSKIKLAGDYAGGHSYDWNGMINDFRLYDNCLSPEDVKRLYQTKIWDIMPYTHMGREFLFDRSGYGLMPLVNTGTTWHGNALYFDGSSRMRPKAGNVGFNLTGGTMSVWFTPKVIPSDYRIIYVDSTSKFGIGFYTTTSMILCSGVQARTSVVTSSFTAGKLYNMIVSYDSGYTAIKAYLNGTALTPSSNNNWGESNGLTLGGRTQNSTSWFNGKVHKVDIFKNQLTAAECIELYNKERTNFLPDEYVQLEYLEGTGTQWIDTEYLVNANNLPKLRYTLDAEATNTAVGNRWWVCGVGGGSLTFYVGIGNGNTSTFPFTYGRGTNDTVTSTYGSIGVRYRWELDMEKQTYKVWSSSREKLVDVAFTRQSPTASLQQTLPLFRWIRYQGNTSTPNGYIFGMKIYGMEMYEDSKLKRNMIPAKRKSDGVLGMYDTVTKKFFTNAGTGTFTAGPEW